MATRIENYAPIGDRETFQGPTDPCRRFDAAAASWDAEHGPASARGCEFLARIHYLSEVCRALGRPRVLDLGCGTGQMLARLSASIRYGLGVDASRSMIERARRTARGPHLEFQVADAVAFCNGYGARFDLVLLTGVLEHLKDQETAIAAARRVLAAHGRLVVISPHPWNFLLQLKHLVSADAEEPPARHLSPHRLAAIARRCGLRLESIRPLPYAAWPALSPVFARIPVTALPAHKDMLAGLVRGAFAAEFRAGRGPGTHAPAPFQISQR
jgi:SAM-dependent methyltransferase